METKRQQLRLFAVLTSAVALFFWVWAILNTIRNGFDLGIVSFLTVMITGTYLFFLAHTRSVNLRGSYILISVVASHTFVALNYMIGVVFALVFMSPARKGYAIYCAVFTVLWAASAGLGGWLLKQYRSSEEAPAGNDSVPIEHTHDS
ncbi:unnamed protein product [Pseudo-nitzschia multistriata]|uniref:MARVEL domain-containing protein n=1 Tax=Pseudo-nitzschia multistriata TaxID=183589 RepID=A0A448YUQ8_9STRA|nr:unnamed protein product [Pseudo-nitzschia multistriata]